jgi:hypothetical protein
MVWRPYRKLNLLSIKAGGSFVKKMHEYAGLGGEPRGKLKGYDLAFGAFNCKVLKKMSRP